MRKLIHRKETNYIEKLLYNPWNQRNWEKLKDSALFKASTKVLSKIYSRANHFRIKDYQFYAIALSHLDAAWLWTVKDGVFRALKTFQMSIKHIYKYPFFKISLTSPQYFEWMERYNASIPPPIDNRSMWAEIELAVKKNRIDLCDGSWVEPDLNVPCGESLVRQRLFGQLYYLRKCGKLA